MVVFPGGLHLSLIIRLNVADFHPVLRNARVSQVITLIKNDQKYPAMFNEILWRDNYQGIEN